MVTTTAAKLATGDQSFSTWLAGVRALFPVADEFDLASEIFSFAAAYEDGRSPAEAYADFDEWASQ